MRACLTHQARQGRPGSAACAGGKGLCECPLSGSGCIAVWCSAILILRAQTVPAGAGSVRQGVGVVRRQNGQGRAAALTESSSNVDVLQARVPALPGGLSHCTQEARAAAGSVVVQPC